MIDFRSPSKFSRPLLRLVAALAAALALLLSTVTAVGASPNTLMGSIGLGVRAPEKKLGVVALGSRMGRALGDLGLDNRHLAHKRRPAFVALAVAAVQEGLEAVEEVLAPIVGTGPAQPLAVVPQPDPILMPPVESPAAPEEPPVTPESEPTPPSEPPATPEEPPATPEEPPPTPEEPPVAPEPEPTPPSEPPAEEPAEEPLLSADFENGLQGWSTAGVGEVVPKVATDIVREGDKASNVQLTGEQDRSELILGGNGGSSMAGTVQFHEGDEYWYGFSFNIQQMIYGHPGAHNLFMQFKSDGEGGPNFGLQLWDYEGDHGEYNNDPKGLWSHGEAMGGDRFLAPVAEDVWHDVRIHFKASSQGAGFYQVYLDGQLVDSREGVSMIVPGHSYAYIKDGLYRNGEEIPGTSDIRLDAAKLGETMESVLP